MISVLEFEYEAGIIVIGSSGIYFVAAVAAFALHFHGAA